MEHIPGARHWADNSEPEGCPRTHRPPFPRPLPRRGIPLQRLGAGEGGAEPGRLTLGPAPRLMKTTWRVSRTHRPRPQAPASFP